MKTKKIAIGVFMIAAAATLLGCSSGGKRPARVRFNEGVAALAKSEWEPAAAAFVEARDLAGQDPELRFRTAFDLGMTYARRAEAEGDDAEKAMGSLQQAIAWFRDAVRLRDGDADARANLEVALRRMQVLSDRLNTGKNALEARLDKLIEDQRGLRDAVRHLMEEAQAQAGGDPLALQSEFEGLATEARVLLAEAGTISDLGADELSRLEGTKEEERSDEDKVRIVQLGNLDVWIQQARSELSDTRRSLHRVDGDAGHRRAEAALGALKRAREQLLDPVKVLKAIAADQIELMAHSRALAELRGDATKLKATPEDPAEAAAAPVVPGWLTTAHLGDRQAQHRDRVDEVLQRFRAGLAAQEQAKAAAPPPDPAAPASPEQRTQEQMIAILREAVPHLETAIAAMEEAGAALTADELAKATDAEQRALEALARAIERFADLRQLIDLAFAEHGQTVTLLTPPDEATRKAIDEQLTTEERARAIRDATARNRERIDRLDGMLADELATIDSQVADIIAQAQAAAAQQQPAPGADADGGVPAAPPAPPDPLQDPEVQQALQQVTAARQQMQLAQELRGKAASALGLLGERLAGSGDLIVPAREALEHITELRRLFFDVIEHLQELLRQQQETRDDTATAQGTDDLARAPLLPPLATRQAEHATLGQAIAGALAEQADAAAASGDPKGAEMGKKMGEAAAEVQAANGDLGAARDSLAEARDEAAAMSVDLDPTLASQAAAIEHLEKALQILSPPQQDQQQQDQEQKDQDQQQDQQQQQDQKDQQQQQQDDRQSQTVREREAQRRKEQRERQRQQDEPVPKDW